MAGATPTPRTTPLLLLLLLTHTTLLAPALASPRHHKKTSTSSSSTSTTTSTPTSSSAPTYPTTLTLPFTPWLTVACEQSFGPGPQPPASNYNLSVANCVTTSYTFGSYFIGGTEAAVKQNCTLTLFADAACAGQQLVTTVPGFNECDIPEFEGASVLLACVS